MRSLSTTFARLKRQHRTAFIPFIMAGDPDLATTKTLLLGLQDAGADVLELGIPFSDPLADGPVIQAASARALRHGTTPKAVLQLAASLRSRLTVPLVCLSYWNPILQFGQGDPAAFARAASQSGIAGVVIPDLSVEEGKLWSAIARRYRVSPIFLAAPTSAPGRLRAIARASRGFIYYVSVTGTTGVRAALPSSLRAGIRRAKRLSRLPVCVGFGISTPQQARTVAKIADGVIVGSALIRTLARPRTRATVIRATLSLARQLRRAIC